MVMLAGLFEYLCEGGMVGTAAAAVVRERERVNGALLQEPVRVLVAASLEREVYVPIRVIILWCAV